MTLADAARFSAMMTVLSDIFGEPMSDTRLQGYFGALSDLSVEQVDAAVREAARSCKFFPKPAELREFCLGSIEDRAAMAWNRMIQAVRHHGPHVSVDFRDRVLHTTIDAMGGWHVLAATLPEDPGELGYRRHEFLQHYRAFERRGVPGPARPYLAGLCEIANTETSGMWNHALDHADTVRVLTTDGVGVLVERPALVGRSMRALTAGDSE